jgi:hypothetical protein
MLNGKLTTAALSFIVVCPAAALAVDCSYLGLEFVKYDAALLKIESSSFMDDSAPRESNRQAAVANILARKGMILDMMIYMECDMPEMFSFSDLGLIGSTSP